MKLEIVDEDIMMFDNAKEAKRYNTFSSKGDAPLLAAGSIDKKCSDKTAKYSSGMMINVVKENAHLYCEHCDENTDLLDMAVNINSKFNCVKCSTPSVIICTLCKRKCSCLRNMYMHLTRDCKSAPARFRCKKCPYKAKERRNLKQHIENKHSAEKCPECDQKISTYTNFLRHQWSDCTYQIDADSLVGVLQCNICEYFTKIKCNLSTHMKNAHK